MKHPYILRPNRSRHHLTIVHREPICANALHARSDPSPIPPHRVPPPVLLPSLLSIPHAASGGRSHRRSISAHLPTPSPSPSPPPPPSIPDAVSILLTHLPTFPESRYAQYGPLCTHPNASSAFATFPPVDRLEFENGDGEVFMVVENPDGCTILDVNRALALLIPFDDYHLGVALEHYQDLAMTSGLSLPQFASAIIRERGFLNDHEYPFLQHIIAGM
ncbi:hypothetical protein C8Q80DRAFT_455726 [Daedaleopsis nitida]|nr:hypothetical protein C8Q80DRAFT_455726 [Daedaleopsis nitida]